MGSYYLHNERSIFSFDFAAAMKQVTLCLLFISIPNTYRLLLAKSH